MSLAKSAAIRGTGKQQNEYFLSSQGSRPEAPAAIKSGTNIVSTYQRGARAGTRETLINGPTSEVAGEMASNFLDDEANRRSIQ
ncbi:hypothetical protein [Paraburkholderia phenoliruptrix]|uniref:hypothetical protein n=1 Tax=Paraburkholderia phenoliruptrix TaxID=252970 RepID=UPI001582D45E|nr:hypothetical protein [Paraburkholderia phenoliruptrix]